MSHFCCIPSSLHLVLFLKGKRTLALVSIPPSRSQLMVDSTDLFRMHLNKLCSSACNITVAQYLDRAERL